MSQLVYQLGSPSSKARALCTELFLCPFPYSTQEVTPVEAHNFNISSGNSRCSLVFGGVPDLWRAPYLSRWPRSCSSCQVESLQPVCVPWATHRSWKVQRQVGSKSGGKGQQIRPCSLQTSNDLSLYCQLDWPGTLEYAG